ncbi:PucR family transcriptional regulator [Pseudonocardia sp. CA-107938]|uniref:PucR family transcriptional regulator n=1 Tax=Pseudonocardia sp. CA-107938 TaxID=3240021 RepID=UPI003D89C1C2
MEDVQRIAEALALRLGRSVAIDDLDMRLLAHTAHAEPVDTYRVESVMRRRAGSARTVTEYAQQFGIATAEGPVRIPASAELGSLARVCTPVRCQGLLLGYLWLMDTDPPLPESDLQLAADAARSAGEALLRAQLLDDVRRAQEGEQVRDLLGADPNVRALTARRLSDDHDLPPSAPALALSVHVTGGDQPGARTVLDLHLQRALQRLAPRVGLSATMGATWATLVVADERSVDRDRLGGMVDALHRELVGSRAGEGAVHIGVGPVSPSLTSVVTSHDRAREAVTVARTIPEVGPVAFWEEIGIYRLLVQLPADVLTGSAVPNGILALSAADNGEMLMATLEAYLDSAGDAAVTARRLTLHRTSLYYRLRRIEEITGMSLRDGGDRLAMHLGLKVLRLSGPPAFVLP